MSSGVSAGSLHGKQNLQVLPVDLKCSSRNVNRADRATSGQWKGIPGAELLEVVAPALSPLLLVIGPTCAFPSYAAPVVLSHTNSECNLMTWSLLMEPLIRACVAFVLSLRPKPYVGTFLELVESFISI